MHPLLKSPFLIDKTFQISYYISMDINIFDDKFKKTLKVRIISKSKVMEDMLVSILSPVFNICEKGENMTVVCCEDECVEVSGPCIYVGKAPKSLSADQILLPRPLDIEKFMSCCLSLVRESTSTTQGWVIDEKSHVLSYKGGEVSLTGKEEKLFCLLFSRMDQCVTRKEIEEALWGDRDVGNSADVYVCHLKKKLENLAGPGCLLAVRGQGYMLKRPL